MTGKFHTSWGDFHSFKNPAALQFECFRMLALGAKCCVGDQLHPTGRICPHTYRLIGDVFRVVEAVEPWCHGAAPLAEVGVLSPEEFAPIALSINQPPAFKGAVRMLDELAVAFDVLDSAADFSRYRALVLPDEVPLAPPLARKLARYLRAGGAVLATHKAGLTPAGDRFALPAFGVRRVGDAPFSPDFIVPRGPLAAGLPPTEHVLYQRGLEVRPARGATVLARVNVPYFNRTGEHFCSHRHTPSAGRADYPAAVRHGRVVYFAHPLFGQYAANAPLWCKRLVANALGLLMPNPLLRSNAPSAAMLTLNAQPAANRWVLHVLHYVPERRGQDFDTIEDVVPLHNVRVSVRDDLGIRSARLAPDGRALRFRRKDGRVEFTIPEVNGYQVVALEGGGNGAVSRRAHRPRTR
jgi:hypothetical protein